MTLENLQFIISLLTLLGFIFAVYGTFRNPDIKADKSISLLKDQIQYERKSLIKHLKPSKIVCIVWKRD